MVRTYTAAALCALIGVGAALTPAAAQDIDFGDNSSNWSNDGECDDPRFEGPGAASVMIDSNRMRDADDCRAAYESGNVTLIGEAPEAGPAVTEIPAPQVLAPAPPPIVDFGDDSSRWANDGECDDPRFEGDGMAISVSSENERRDAADCRALYEAGSIRVRAVEESAVPDYAPSTSLSGDVDFGDDSSSWANDGECDDPRFEGDGMAISVSSENERRDAADCRALYEAGSIRVRAVEEPPVVDVVPGGSGDVDFGDDSSRWANDGECDDPRFVGDGMASVLLPEDARRDASDCRALYERGSIRLADSAQSPAIIGSDIDFGDDASRWANDGECDDPRFEGPGTAATLLDADERHDATDCRAQFESGRIWLKGAAPVMSPRPDVGAINFGDDSGQWANDGECDDPRFVGEGVAASPSASNMGRDASDCRMFYSAGTIDMRADASVGRSEADAAGVDFGDNTSRWADDGECDDPRFQGEGMAGSTEPSNEGRDAGDCRRLFLFGALTLRSDAGPSIMTRMAQIEFGVDAGETAGDGVCDDPRFVGQAVSETAVFEGADASDCRMLYRLGAVVLKTEAPGYESCQAIVFGDDSGSYANDNECDDPRFVGEATGATDIRNILRDASDCRRACEMGGVTLRAE